MEAKHRLTSTFKINLIDFLEKFGITERPDHKSDIKVVCLDGSEYGYGPWEEQYIEVKITFSVEGQQSDDKPQPESEQFKKDYTQWGSSDPLLTYSQFLRRQEAAWAPDTDPRRPGGRH